jgi:hypothetical protein
VRSTCVVAAFVVAGCGADLANNAAIHAHVNELVMRDREHAVAADRLALSAGALVPIYGTYRLDKRVFGSVRPSAIVFDWVLGGLAPVACLAASFATSGDTRTALRWTALGLYAGTRVGVLVIGNLHVSEYDGYLERRLADTSTGRTLGLALGARW